MNEFLNIKKLKLTKEQELLKNKKFLLDFNKEKWKERDYGEYYKTFLMFITNRCNLNCKNCFNKANLNNSEEMSFKYIKKIVDVNNHVDKYDIMGGEPLLHPQLNKIFDYLEKKNKKIGLYTNGFLLKNYKFDRYYKSLKINIAFHSIESCEKINKSIVDLKDAIFKYQSIYPIKLVFLVTEENYYMIYKFAEYIEENFKYIKKITIGIVRDEEDYWNDNIKGIMPLEKYVKFIEDFLNNYKGNLDIDIFGEGIIYSENLPKSQKNQLNRFKCVFPNNKYSSCLYDVASDKKIIFDSNKKIPFCDHTKCPKTNKKRCLTDKIKLINKNNI